MALLREVKKCGEDICLLTCNLRSFSHYCMKKKKKWITYNVLLFELCLKCGRIWKLIKNVWSLICRKILSNRVGHPVSSTENERYNIACVWLERRLLPVVAVSKRWKSYLSLNSALCGCESVAECIACLSLEKLLNT